MTLLLSALLGVAALVGIAAVAVVTMVVRSGLRPLEQVAERAAGIDAGSLNVRFPTDGLPSELRPICQRLNESLERLEGAFKRERRFTADVAHELRTPIAELRALADVALKWPGNPETSAAYFKDAQEIAQQMETIVTTLLALARCQSGSTRVSYREVVLSNVVQEGWNGHAVAAVNRGLTVTFHISPSLVVETDRSMLFSMVANLLSNAVEYTPRGGSIECRAEVSGSEAWLAVSNNTDSLEPDDLPHVFEPFWRKDPARTDSSHSGLGLTLVAAYAEILGGRVEATLRERTLSIAVALPYRTRGSDCSAWPSRWTPTDRVPREGPEGNLRG
jgi:two-component system sensor histidine kinase QseC